MGIFDLLSKEGRARSSLEGNIKKVNNKFVAAAERYPAMLKLKEMATDEALYGLLRRFSFVSEGKVMKGEMGDEDEKQWVIDTMVDLGDRAFAPVRRFILEGETVSNPLRILERIAKPDKVLEVIDEMCEREEPGYTRHPQKKIQMLGWLSEWKAKPPAEITRRIVPYVKDFDETVRFTAIDALAHQSDEATARGPLLDALIRPEEESRRILVRIAEVLAEAGWRVDDTPEHKQGVVKLLAGPLPEFGLSHEKLFRKGK